LDHSHELNGLATVARVVCNPRARTGRDKGVRKSDSSRPGVPADKIEGKVECGDCYPARHREFLLRSSLIASVRKAASIT